MSSPSIYDYKTQVDIHSFSGSVEEHYLTIGGGVASRKWDVSQVPTNWAELWVGMRFAWQPRLYYSSSANGDVWFGSQHIFMGIGDSSGVVYGESGSIKHCYGVIFFTNENGTTTRYNTAKKTRYVLTATSPRVYITGSTLASSGNSTNYQSEEYRHNMVILRFARTADPGNMQITLIYPSTAAALDSGNSGSSILAEAMSKNTWTQAQAYAVSYGSTANALATRPINQTSNGVFDSVVITNPYRWSDITLYEVVIRASGSI